METAKPDIVARGGAGDRVSTGIEGLDYVLGGGLPRNRFYLIEGLPGTGKTTIALQFLLAGRRSGETGLYVSLSETKEELEDVVRSHGWSLDGIGVYELAAIEDKLHPDEQYTVFHPAEVELNETTVRITAEIERLKPQRIVFDSLSEMRLLAHDPLRYRRQILALKQFFSGRDCTVLLLDDLTERDKDLQLRTMAHGVMVLERLPLEYGAARRRLHITKLRGVQYRDGYHDMTIRQGGVSIFPRLIAAESRNGDRQGGAKLSSGVPEMDALLGGGLERGSGVLLTGPAGAGKSILMTQFAVAAAQRGERVAMYLFEETRETCFERSRGLGIPVESFVEAGLIGIQQIDPAELGPGEFAHVVKSAVLDGSARLVVIDSLNGYLSSMPSERYLTNHIHELLTYLGHRGVVTLMSMAQHGLVGGLSSPVELSSIADTVVLLRFFEAQGSVRQAISVLKKRRGAHERTIRELSIGPQGVRVGAPITNFQGVLTGLPVYTGEDKALFRAEADAAD